MKALQIAGLLGASLLASTAMAATPHAPWSYQGDQDPAHWAGLDSVNLICGQGKNQSPIDIRGAAHAHLPPLDLAYDAKGTNIINNGHTVQVAAPEGDVLHLEGKDFNLVQMHFHEPSEHAINGQHFPLEAHLVHADADSNLAVVSVLFQEGEANAALAPLVGELPSAVGETRDLTTPVDFAAIIPSEQQYYRIDGSLTTPPCTEGVRWVVLEAPASVSADQVAAFANAIGGPNNRPLQDINARIPID
ncbi:carbonic anhydrase [Halomonas sp. V046]|uniref:carbonic anhydrase n=1 Tax=Halomonas sp. V046 TaxID=3459611 RepID=UPI004043F99C